MLNTQILVWDQSINLDEFTSSISETHANTDAKGEKLFQDTKTQ